jgi:hypothetical protein
MIYGKSYGKPCLPSQKTAALGLKSLPDIRTDPYRIDLMSDSFFLKKNECVAKLGRGIAQCEHQLKKTDEKLKIMQSQLTLLMSIAPTVQLASDFRLGMLAFCMSQHPRLGHDSLASELHAELIHMIFAMVDI